MRKPVSSEHESPVCCDAVRVTVHAMDQIDPDAGNWLPSPRESIAIVSRLYRPGLLVVKMDNTSMEPVIRRGAYVGIDEKDRALGDGRIQALDIDREGLILRRVVSEQDGKILLLQAENPVYPAQRHPGDAATLRVLGTVVWVIQDI
ncbi:MAG: helix-turn-helix transcriptional regulator [Acidobacteriota bacterium]